MPGRPDVALASMGIYVFNPRLLERLLRADAEDPDSAHDFGKNIIPQAIENLRVFAYPFEDVRSKAQHYWRDVGTIDAYYEANMELVRVSPELNIYDEQWPIWTYQEQLPPAKFVFDDEDRRGCAIDSMVSGGCIISGSRVSNSLLFSQVRVHDYSTVDRSVILPRVRIGEHCVIRNAIIDEGAVVPDGTTIGVDPAQDRERFYVSENGVTLVTASMLRAPARSGAADAPGRHRTTGSFARDVDDAAAKCAVADCRAVRRAGRRWRAAPRFGQNLESPELSLVGIQMLSTDMFAQKFKVRVLVKNPNDLEIPGARDRLHDHPDGRQLRRGRQQRPVPAAGERRGRVRHGGDDQFRQQLRPPAEPRRRRQAAEPGLRDRGQGAGRQGR